MKQHLRKILPVSVAFFLTACSVGPDFMRPDSPLPQYYSLPHQKDVSTQNELVNSQWWKLFGDETLNDLVEVALKNNTNLRQAYARIEEAQALVRQTQSSFFPSFNLGADGARQYLSNQISGRTEQMTPRFAESYSGLLSMNYELDLWGRVRRSNEQQQASLLSTLYAKDTTRLTIIALVVTNYLALRAADAQLIVTANTLKTREESALLTKNRMDAGLVSPIDYHQARGLLAQAHAQEADYNRQRALAEHQLALITAQPELKIPKGDLKFLPVPPVPPVGLPAQLIENRPDVKQAEAQLIAANAGIGVARSYYFPSFNLTGSLGSSAALTSRLFEGTSSLWSIALNAAMPVLNWSAVSAQVDAAKAINKQSQIAWEATLHTAYQEVRDALVSVREQEIAEAAAIIQADSARHVLEIASQRYKAGHTGYLELLDSERTHNEAEIGLITIRQARLNATVNLFKALGGGWQPDFVWKDGIFPAPEPVDSTKKSADSEKTDSASIDSANTMQFENSEKTAENTQNIDSLVLAKSLNSSKAVDSAMLLLQNRQMLQ